MKKWDHMNCMTTSGTDEQTTQLLPCPSWKAVIHAWRPLPDSSRDSRGIKIRYRKRQHKHEKRQTVSQTLLFPSPHSLDPGMKKLLSPRLKRLIPTLRPPNRHLRLPSRQTLIGLIYELVERHADVASTLDIRLMLRVVQFRYRACVSTPRTPSSRRSQLRTRCNILWTAGGKSSTTLTLEPLSCSRRHRM